MNVTFVTVTLPDTANDWQGDTKAANIFRAPTAANGGVCRILEAWAVNQAATTAGTGFAISLLNYGTAGTAVEGTVAGSIGGLADPWAAGTPKAFTISDGVVESGEYIAVYKDEDNSSDPTRMMVGLVIAIGR